MSDTAGLLSLRTQRSVCYQCHSGQDGATNVLGQFRRGDGGLSQDSSGHRVVPNADPQGLQCTDCHTPHQDPAENPGELRVQVLNPDTGHKVWLYNTADEPIGNGFCYACHGPKDSTVQPPPPAPFGDFTAFEAGAHSSPLQMQEAAESDEQQAAEDDGTAPAEGTPADLKQDDQTTGKIVCLFCHAPHDSDYLGIATADQEALCYQCHTRADPNTADGTSPYKSFNAATNSYGDGSKDSSVSIFHHPIAVGEQQDGSRTVECVSCHNPHFDAATNVGDNAQIANPRHTTAAWPRSATNRGDPTAAADGEKTIGSPSAFDSSPPVTYGPWARALLSQLDAPSCRDNRVTVVAWETQEGTAALWNPLATTYSVPGATSINRSGVKDYESMAQGLDATRLTLTGSSPSNKYRLIVLRLKNCAPAVVTARAIRKSAWCSCGRSGSYLATLLNTVEADYQTYADKVVPGAASSFEGSVDTVNSFCTMCHIAPEVTTPIKKSDTVSYGVHLVNDTTLDPGGQPHDLFTADQYPDSLHGSMACTACHDVHGSSNAYALRNQIVAPDGSTKSVFNFGGTDRPEDIQKYASFCLTCHEATAQDHVDGMVTSGTYCRECHYHGSDQF